MRRMILGLVMALAVTMPPSAVADTEAVEDSRDQGNVVDPIEASHAHHESLRGVLVHTVRTADPWQDGDLFGMTMDVWIPDGDQQPDRQVIVGFNPDRSMYVLVDKWDGGLQGHGNAWMVDDRTIRFEFAKRLLGRGLGRYQWQLTVSVRCAAPEGTTCPPQRDVIPDEGRVVHDLK